MKLKKGTTEDPRLDRIESPVDERNKNHHVMADLKEKSGRSYTWRCKLHLNQGKDGACVGFGFAHNIIARPVEVAILTDSYAKKNIYWAAQKVDNMPGGSYPGSTKFYEGKDELLLHLTYLSHQVYIVWRSMYNQKKLLKVKGNSNEKMEKR